LKRNWARQGWCKSWVWGGGVARDVPDPDTGIRYPVKFRHAQSGIRYKFAGYLPDNTVRYFLTTMKRKSLLGVNKLWNTNNYWACAALRRNYDISFSWWWCELLFRQQQWIVYSIYWIPVNNVRWIIRYDLGKDK
jgi:hypothetical protein